MAAMKISDEVMKVLGSAEVVGGNLYMTHLGTLDRKLYTEVNKVLEAIGGKWNRSAKAHVFPEAASNVIDPILLTGEYSRTKQDFGQFDTPPDVVARVMELSEIENFGHAPLVLEPSIGLGNIAAAAEAAGASVAGIEVDAKRLHAAKERLTLALGIKLSDFLAQAPKPIFDLVLMNPPFAGQADIDHVTHALKFVKPGGRLVAIMSAAVLYRDNEKTRKFRDLIGEQATGVWEELDAGAFKASGTMVRACIVAVDVR
jgi:predicted RNA methylase